MIGSFLTMMLLQAAGAAPPRDVGVCAPLVAVVDPDGDGVFENTGSDAAMAAAEKCRSAGDPRGAVSVAYVLRNAGQRDAARAALKDVLESAEAERVRCLIDTDDKLPDALAHCDRTIALRPGWALAHGSRANALKMLGRLEDALASANEAVRLGAGDPGLHATRAGVYEAMGRKEEALADFVAAARLAPRAVGFLNDQARLQTALGRTQEAAALLDRSIALKPTGYAYNERGKLRRDAKQYELGDADFAKAELLEPKWAQPWLEAADGLQSRQQYPASIEALNKAIALDPKWAAPLYSRGFSYAKMGRRAEAEADYLRAAALAPKWASPLMGLSSLALDVREYAKALQWARQAIAVAPEYYGGYNDAGFALYNLGQKQAALENYNQSLALKPTNQPSLFWRARTQTDLKNEPAAIADYTKLVTVNPGYGWAWANRGALRHRAGEDEGAIADLDRAAPILNGQSVFWDVWLGINLAVASRGEIDFVAKTAAHKARLQNAIDRMMKAWPQQAVAGAYHARGMLVLYRDNDPAKALADLSRAVTLQPNNERYSSRLQQAQNRSQWLQACRNVPPINVLIPLDRVTPEQKDCYSELYAMMLVFDGEE